MKEYKNKKIGITGYKGYLGSALYHKLKKIDCDLTCIDVDVSNKKEMKKKLGKKKFDIIFHLAASQSYWKKNQNVNDIILERETNSSSILYFYDLFKNSDTKMVFTSSTNVYGDVENDTVDENTITNPQSLWSSHKILAENYLNILFKNSMILRIPNIFGVNDDMVENNISDDVVFRPIINRVMKYGTKDGFLKLYKNKDCLRDYLFIDDLIDALLLAGIHDGDENYYVLGGFDGQKNTISKVWDMLSDLLKLPIQYNGKDLKKMEMRSYIANYDKFKELTGWNPQYTVMRGIFTTHVNLSKR